MPSKAREYVGAELDKWANFGVEGHFEKPLPWVSIDESVRDASARLVGAQPLEVCVMNSLTVNLHLMMVAFYRPTKTRFKILVEGKAFPSDMHMLQSQVRFHGFDPSEALVTLEPRPGEVTLRTEDIEATIAKLSSPSPGENSDRAASSSGSGQGELALVMMSGVQYYTGQRFDVKAITAAAHRHGVPIGWDLAHAVGNVPLALHDDGPDFACWCTYKYLNSGPGNIAGCFVHERHAFDKKLADATDSPEGGGGGGSGSGSGSGSSSGSCGDMSIPRFSGWWGHRASDRFDMAHQFIPSPGAQGFMLSNPPVLCCAALRASLDSFDAAGGVGALRRKSERLTGYLEALLGALDEDPRLKGQVAIFTPRDVAARGCQLSLTFRYPGGVGPVFERLMAKGVICDVRKPDVMRVAPAPLYNSFADVLEFSQLLREVLLDLLAADPSGTGASS